MKASGETLALLLLYSLLVGAFLGVLWDTFRILRIMAYGKSPQIKNLFIPLPSSEKEVKKALSVAHTQKFFSTAGILIFISDILFSITAAISLILLVFHINNGDVRAVALVGAAVGFTAYYFTVGKVTVFFSEHIIRLFKKISTFFIKLLVLPILKTLFKPLCLLLTFILAYFRKIQTKKFIKKRIKEAFDGFGILKEKTRN